MRCFIAVTPKGSVCGHIFIRTCFLENKNIRDLYRGINDFKRGYEPRSNLVKDENGDLLADSHNILNR
jgi:hypothetical protein